MYVSELQLWWRSRTGVKLHLRDSQRLDGSICGGIIRLKLASGPDIESMSVCSQCVSKAHALGIYV
jgi:hypothetical protein